MKRLHITVLDYQMEVLKDAEVRISAESDGTEIPVEKEFGVAAADPTEEGLYRITADHPTLQAQERVVQISAKNQFEMFVLGKKRMPFFWRGRHKVPYVRRRGKIGVIATSESSMSDAERADIIQLLEGTGLQYKATDPLIEQDGILIFSLKRKYDIMPHLEAQSVLSESPLISMAGPILYWRQDKISIMTDELTVGLHEHVTQEVAEELAQKYDLELLRSIPYAGNTFHFRWKKPLSYNLIRVCNRIHDRPEVEWVDLNLFHNVVGDAVTPSNYLFPMQWDLERIQASEAWQHLRDEDPDLTFGSPNITVAVVDSGVDASHPKLNGTLTDGSPKVSTLFDFTLFQPNNDFTVANGMNHGTGCAGAATALAQDSGSPNDVGTSGVAGNCHLMGIRYGGSEIRYSDMYIWLAGFDPESPNANFPAPLSKGADVISSSFGFANPPISPLMQRTFDFITTYGREGRGTLLFFSAGNGTTLISSQRPWAAYEKTFGIAASTRFSANPMDEVQASYSNFGNEVELCAPSRNSKGVFDVVVPVVRGAGFCPGQALAETALSSDFAAGDSRIDVDDAAVINDAFINQGANTILIGNRDDPRSTARGINNIVGDTIGFSMDLFHDHTAGEPVVAGPGNYNDKWTGTSHSTPVCAGVAALMLSANPNLTWIEVRELLRATAAKIDSTTLAGGWVDVNGNPTTDPTLAHFSPLYGYGRVDSAAAVRAALDYNFKRELVIRDNLTDDGTVPSSGRFWASCDLWVRTLDPAVDPNPAPSSYTEDAAAYHQTPTFGSDAWVYARIKNLGPDDSYPFEVNFYLTHFAGAEFIYPEDFIPIVHPNSPMVPPLQPGCYGIGKQPIPTLPSNAEIIVPLRWDASLVPPETVDVGGTVVAWHPCLLAEISPHDGVPRSGIHIWDDNNLAQRNISIIYPPPAPVTSAAPIATAAPKTSAVRRTATSDQVAKPHLTATVIGNRQNTSSYLELEIFREEWPEEAMVFLGFSDSNYQYAVDQFVRRTGSPGIYFGHHQGRRVLCLGSQSKILLQLPNWGPQQMWVGIESTATQGVGTRQIGFTQINDRGETTGAFAVDVRFG